MAQVEIKVTKSPVISTHCSENSVENSVVYYIRLSNGAIVTKPEDFPENHEDASQ